MAKTAKKLDLIQELTTYKNDYKQWPLPKDEEVPGGVDDGSRAKAPVQAPPEVDWQSLLEYNVHVPFDLFVQEKAIVGTDPCDPIPREGNAGRGGSTGEKKEFAYKLPGKSRMEVTDEELVRNLLLSAYSPPHRGWIRDACLSTGKPPKIADRVVFRQKVSFEPELYSPLPSGWLAAAKHWDCLQSRTLGDPTRTFWSRRGPEVECFSKSDFNEIIPNEMKKEIRTLIDEDKLRLPFHVPKTGYGGYRQMCAKGVPLRRNKDFQF